MIDQVEQRRLTQDTLILQKVNKTHREAFKTRFPGQVEHSMRLVAERLQAILMKKPTDLSNPETWIATAGEIESLSNSLHVLSIINKEFPVEHEDL
jgi:hypothetical protein|tara:strand:- start:2815 stop:3102 length:288 start_codon:yes stop_codon:yes gene_type:complete